MRGMELLEKMELVDAAYVEAADAEPKKKGKVWAAWTAMAACLCLAILGISVWRQSAPSPREDTGLILSESGVTIPQMKVSLSANEEACMIAFFIYQDRWYVHYERLSDGADLIGDHLGTATGLIDEWTTKDGYVELAGSVEGDFYAVKGYDPSFLLCMRDATGAVDTYICNNGITLKYGSELYEDRLHLSDRFETVQYESRASWYFSQGERYQMNSVNDIVLDFIKALDSAQFIPYDSVPLGEGRDSLADTELYHLYFRMEDGTTVHLRLHENGYIRFQGVMDLCVQVSEETYGALLNLLDNRIDSTAVEVTGAVGPTFEDCRNNADLGRYVPTYTPEELYLVYADIYYYLDRQTAAETGTKEIYLEYESLEDPHCYYSVTITWADEYGQNGWAGPMIEAGNLSVEAVSEYIETDHRSGTPLPKNRLDVGVWYDDVSVVISAAGVDAETAYRILSSARE